MTILSIFTSTIFIRSISSTRYRKIKAKKYPDEQTSGQEENYISHPVQSGFYFFIHCNSYYYYLLLLIHNLLIRVTTRFWHNNPKRKDKVRQPLQKIMIPALSEIQKQEIEAVADLIKSEVNVKEIQLLDDASGILVKQIKPNFKVLGPKFGKDMKKIAEAVGKLEQEDIQRVAKKYFTPTNRVVLYYLPKSEQP